MTGIGAYGAPDPNDVRESQRLLEQLRTQQTPLPQARVFNSANIATTSGAAKVLTFDSERWDNGNLHDTGANTDRLTAPITGLYVIGANALFAANATGFRQMEILVNATTIIGHQVVAAVIGGATTIVQVAAQYQLLAGDYVTTRATQSSGGALNIVAVGNYSPEFWMHRVGGYVNEGV